MEYYQLHEKDKHLWSSFLQKSENAVKFLIWICAGERQKNRSLNYQQTVFWVLSRLFTVA